MNQTQPITTAHEFGKIVATRRKALGMTQEDLALHVGCSSRLISEVERGLRVVSFEKTLRIARLLGIDIFYKVR